jgi:CHAT domain-containing protein
MTRTLLCIAALAGLLAAPADAALIPERQKLFVAGRFAELEVLMEKEIGNDPAPNSAKLLFQCAAYSKLKRYNKLFPCLEKLEANVRRGDTAMNDIAEMERDSPFLAGLARMGAGMAGGKDGGKVLEGTVVPFLHILYAEAWNEFRDYPRAAAAARAAMETVPRGWSIERGVHIMALTAQGLAEGFGGRREAALKIAGELAAIDTSYPHTLLASDKMLGLARIYVSIGDFARANEALMVDTSSLLGSLAIGMADSIAGMDAGESMFSYVEMPKEYLRYKTQFETGAVAPAKAGFDKLLQDKRTASNGEIYWLLLFDRGRIAETEGDLDTAIRLWREAIEIIEQQRSSISTEANKIGFIGDKQSVYRRLIGALFARGLLGDAFDYLERSKSRALVDLLAGKKDFAVSGGDAQAIRALLAQAESQELVALAQGAGPSGSRRSAAAAPATALREQAPELASLVSVGATPLPEIQERLAADETLVEYYYDGEWLYAFVLTRESLRAARTPVGDLEDELRAWRGALEDPAATSPPPVSQALHQRLIGPIAGWLDRPRLTLVAHGALHYVPLAALHNGNDYLIDRHALRLLPSASVMKYLRLGDGGKAAGVLALGNPDLGDPALDLRHAQDEATEIARMVPASRAFLRKEANAATLRDFGAGFRYLHFATHGEFRADKPLDSALLLSPGNGDDGQLTVSRLYSMRLESDLVTLSACETGLGKVASGEDVVGLTRGFLYAGAATIVASLWKVDDLATAELMRAFYGNLARMDKLEALRQAQLETRKRLPAPFFWAPFQLIGNPLGGRYQPAAPPPPVIAVTPPEAPAAKAAAGRKSGPGELRRPLPQ